MDKRTLEQYEYIDLLLAYEGLLTNSRIREKFNITNVQASRIIAAYREDYPRNLKVVTGEGRGRYTVTKRFKPATGSLTLGRYVDLAANKIGGAKVEWVSHDFAGVNIEIFRALNKASKDGSATQILYRSMNHPKGIVRIIHPSAFVFAGRRWHVRAFDQETSEHRDFNLSRIFQAEKTDQSLCMPPDTQWEEIVQLNLRAHPLLTLDQQQLIRDELFNGAAGRQIRTRRALIHYVLRDLEVATNIDSQKPPEYQLYCHLE